MITTIKTYTIAMDAYIAKGRLEAEGIPAYIADEHYITLDWTISVAIGGVRVQVPYAYIEQANQVISDLEQGEYEVTDTEEQLEHEEAIQPAITHSSTTHCPKCNSDNTHPFDLLWKISLVFLILGHLPLPFSRHLHKCNNGHFWIATEERGHAMYVHIFAFILDAFLIIVFFSVLYYWSCKPYYCVAPF